MIANTSNSFQFSCYNNRVSSSATITQNIWAAQLQSYVELLIQHMSSSATTWMDLVHGFINQVNSFATLYRSSFNTFHYIHFNTHTGCQTKVHRFCRRFVAKPLDLGRNVFSTFFSGIKSCIKTCLYNHCNPNHSCTVASKRTPIKFFGMFVTRSI